MKVKEKEKEKEEKGEMKDNDDLRHTKTFKGLKILLLFLGKFLSNEFQKIGE